MCKRYVNNLIQGVGTRFYRFKNLNKVPTPHIAISTLNMSRPSVALLPHSSRFILNYRRSLLLFAKLSVSLIQFDRTCDADRCSQYGSFDTHIWPYLQPWDCKPGNNVIDYCSSYWWRGYPWQSCGSYCELEAHWRERALDTGWENCTRESGSVVE